MKEFLMHGIAKTMMDGVRDANMQYEYAVEAKEHGDIELAKAHIDEARSRINGAKVWHERRKKMMGEHNDPFVKVMEREWCDWWKMVDDKITAFHAEM